MWECDDEETGEESGREEGRGETAAWMEVWWHVSVFEGKLANWRSIKVRSE